MSDVKSHRLSTFQGSLIVLGTSVGGGMLGLPIMTSEGGFIPSTLMLLLSWIFMTFTGLLLGELVCRKKHNVNLLTLYSQAFPKIGGFIATIVYFILFYSLMVAYLLALSRMIEGSQLFAGKGVQGYVSFVALLGVFFLFCMRSWLSRVNGFLVTLMAISFFLFCGMAARLVDFERLGHQEWLFGIQALPLIFTSFGFQGTVPSLASLMGYDRTSLFKSIIIGTFATLVIYIIWQAIILSAIPVDGHMGLVYAKQRGLDAITPLAFHLPEKMELALLHFGKIFAFSAVATSLIGVSIGMHDFIADFIGAHHKTPLLRFILACCVYLPSLVFSLLFPSAFLVSLSVAGGIGCAFLLGIMPTCTAVRLFSKDEEQQDGNVFVKKVLKVITSRGFLFFSALFFISELVLESILLINR